MLCDDSVVATRSARFDEYLGSRSLEIQCSRTCEFPQRQ